MNRLHKMIRLSLVQKFYCLFGIFVVYGWYKNAFIPYMHHFYSFSYLILILLYPISGFLVGLLFDVAFQNHCPFPNRFYGLLFSLIVPISTNICFFLFFLVLLLAFNTFFINKKDKELNFIVLGKLILVLLLFLSHHYQYANLLEESHMFVYSYLDSIFGNNVSGLFTSNVFLILISYVLLFFDTYYKKEIPLYSYGVYLLTLVCYAILKSNMNLILSSMFSSSVLFAFAFIAPLSSFSPYSKKRTLFYSVLLGFGVLPFSLITNFYEGVYFALFLANISIIFLNGLQMRWIRSKMK